MRRRSTPGSSLGFATHTDMYDLAPTPPSSLDLTEYDFPEIRWVVQEYQRQASSITGQEAKTVYAMHQIDELHRYGYLTKIQAFQFMQALDETVSFENVFAQVHAAAQLEQLKLYVEHMHKLIRIGAKNIAEITDKSLYPPPPEPKRRGLIYRLWYGER